VATQRRQSVSQALAGRSVLLAGASGFVGKLVLAACLNELPELREIRLLLRADDDAAARRRLEQEVLGSNLFDHVSPEVALAVESGRLHAIAGDLTAERLGRASGAELGDVDVVINCAASVSFEQPLDDALELNSRGPVRLLEALEAAGSRPAIVHISTAYAAGARTGLVLERPSGAGPAEPEVDMLAELAAARAWRKELESESRLPRHQRRFVERAREEAGPAGAPAIGTRAERERRAWVAAQLTERGRVRSRALGWTDSYGLSKALGERLLIARRPEALTILRPTIIESARRRPYPGWIEGLKVADPVILAYAQGMVPRFPGDPSVRLDLVPVDMVAHACIAAAALPPDGGPRTIAIASGSRNPLSIGAAAAIITDYFRERPLPADGGPPVEVPGWRFSSGRRVLAALDRGERGLAAARRVLERVPIPQADRVERRLHQERRRLERLRRLAEIYGPYAELDCMFDDRGARELYAALEPEDRERFDFDTAAIDWQDYLHEVHLPALRELARAARPVRRAAPASPARPAEGPPALALFDVEGVVLDATVAHFYAWLRARSMPAPDRYVWLAALAARAPRYLVADRRSRAAFNRRFYREYEGLPAGELRDEAHAALSEFILPRMRHAAVRRIREHRRRGDHVVLMTGALDLLVEPLRHLGDELVAARLAERRGAFTGELVEPPLTADGRASLAARLAAERGVDLGDCHAYGDSVSDLPLLEAVGHPVAVNPDFRLAREARRRAWPVLEWETEPGARTGPPAPVEVSG
jgi:HAD superfamily hydrolase (TIGR01490 family)